MRLLGAALALVPIVGCTPGSLATADPSTPNLGAVLGPVMIAVEPEPVACAYVTRTDGERLGLIWSTDPEPRIVNDAVMSGDQVLARDGDVVWLGGGTIPSVPEKLSGCPVDAAFVVGDLFHRDPLGP